MTPDALAAAASEMAARDAALLWPFQVAAAAGLDEFTGYVFHCGITPADIRKFDNVAVAITAHYKRLAGDHDARLALAASDLVSWRLRAGASLT